MDQAAKYLPRPPLDERPLPVGKPDSYSALNARMGWKAAYEPITDSAERKLRSPRDP